MELIPLPLPFILNQQEEDNWDTYNNNNNNNNVVPILLDNIVPEIDFSKLDSNLDPQIGGKLQPGSLRSKRKQCAIESFVYVFYHYHQK